VLVPSSHLLECQLLNVDLGSHDDHESLYSQAFLKFYLDNNARDSTDREFGYESHAQPDYISDILTSP
jgi:hypothetical protein